MEKMEAHRQGLLHRAFSVFVFNGNGDLILQKRASSKYHSGGLWTNTCCSHPKPGECTLEAAERRLQEEMGFRTTLKKLFHFTYMEEFENGLTEHEFDHVFVGEYIGELNPDPEEVEEIRYINLDRLEKEMSERPSEFTIWLRHAFPGVKALISAEKL